MKTKIAVLGAFLTYWSTAAAETQVSLVLSQIEEAINTCEPVLAGVLISANFEEKTLKLQIKPIVEIARDVSIPFDQLQRGGMKLSGVEFTCKKTGCIEIHQHMEVYPFVDNTFRRSTFSLSDCMTEDAMNIGKLVWEAVQCLKSQRCS